MFMLSSWSAVDTLRQFREIAKLDFGSCRQALARLAPAVDSDGAESEMGGPCDVPSIPADETDARRRHAQAVDRQLIDARMRLENADGFAILLDRARTLGSADPIDHGGSRSGVTAPPKHESGNDQCGCQTPDGSVQNQECLERTIDESGPENMDQWERQYLEGTPHERRCCCRHCGIAGCQ
jgi:hypothetical protein